LDLKNSYEETGFKSELMNKMNATQSLTGLRTSSHRVKGVQSIVANTNTLRNRKITETTTILSYFE
jgi:hypothetical protein